MLIAANAIAIGFGQKSKLLVMDTFNRADSALALGTADTGQVWTNNSGILGISSNKVYMPSGSSAIATLDSKQSKVAVSFVDSGIQESGFFNGVIARYTDTSNYVRAVLQTTTLFLQRRQAGTTTVLNSVAVTRNDGDIYKLVADGTTLTVFKNGVNILTVSESFNNSATRQGMIVSTALARMDNFTVEEL